MADRWIERFRHEVVPLLISEFEAEKIILFGSRVQNTAREESDIDVIVISSYFITVPFLKRMPLILRKAPFPKHIDYICYTPEEYERIKNESSVIMSTLESCIEIETS